MDSSDIEFTPEEVDQLVNVFKVMRIKPKTASPSDLLRWMTDYVSSVENTQSRSQYFFTPRLPMFGGEKTHTSFDFWKYQVVCLQNEHIPEEIIKQAIRTSLQGEAGNVVMHLGPLVSVDGILTKMDGTFGDVKNQCDILAEFYSAKQDESEDVKSWGMRLEGLLNRATSSRGNIKIDEYDATLRSAFWHGLQPHIKRISGYTFDLKTTFNELMLAIRHQEMEHNQTSKTKEETSDKLNNTIRPKKKKTNKQDTYQRTAQLYDHIEEHQEQLPPPLRRHHDIRCWRCNQLGHIAVECHVRLDHSRRMGYYDQAYTTKAAVGISRKQLNKMTRIEVPGLVGSANEGEVSINHHTTFALLDTGSTVSTISEEFYKKNLLDQPIQPLQHFLEIECADGQQMPYLVYVETTLTVPNNITRSLESCIFLVVPTSKYHASVPVLIGTNILTELLQSTKQRFGQKFLQTARLQTPWYLTYRCMVLREKELDKHGNRLALVRNAETVRKIIKPNSSIIIDGYLDQEIPTVPTTAMLMQTPSSAIPEDLDITPAVICYSYKHTDRIPVQINNVSTRTVVLEPRSTTVDSFIFVDINFRGWRKKDISWYT